MICPDCHHDNIPGVDYCAECHTDLRALDVPQPTEGLQSCILVDRLTDVGTGDSAALSPEDTVAAAVETMRQTRRGAVLIAKDKQLAGIFTEWDLVNRVPFGADLTNYHLQDVMTPNPTAYAGDATVAHALNAMAVGNLRHLPIVNDDGTVDQQLSVRDLLTYLCEKVL